MDRVDDMGAPKPTVSVIIHRSRILAQHHAWVRIGDVDAGYRDLRTGEMHCPDEQLRGIVESATAPLLAGPAEPSPTAALYRSTLAAATAHR